MDENEKHVLEFARIPFDMDEFFGGQEKLRCATVLITSQQAITIPNIEDWKGFHTSTQEWILKVIYNMKKNSPSELRELNRKSIRMHLIASKEYKLIKIKFPSEITEEQVKLLQAYQKTYGNIVKRISEKYVRSSKYNSPVVLIDGEGGKDNYCHSFKEAVKHAQNLPKVETQDTPDEIILGQVISSDGLTLRHSSELKSLELFNDKALNNGVTTADCNSFGGYIKSLWKKMIGGR